MLDMCKLTAALVFAAIAGLTAIAAGLMNDVRISVILLRTVCVFLITGVLVYIGVFLFEKFGYEKLIKETRSALTELDAQEQFREEKEAGEAEQPEAAEDEASVKGDGFAPLQADSLRRVTGSAEN
ncbi:MAG: hypothetical protein PHQ44_00525 [Anaerovibrio sp.]|nr:hypothetical protein [Anaerovibrio sp.]